MFVGAFALSLLFVSPALAAKCRKDSKQVGPTCVDTHEASVWEIPATEKRLIKRVQKGKATEAHLIAGGATQRGIASDDYPCDDNGNDCANIYAVSIAGVTPSRFITWFQAQQASLNSGKRLLTNAEWQAAAAGTVDPGGNDGRANTKCHTGGGSPRETGNAGATPGGADSCISRWGVQDMAGNLWEWVADWVPPMAGLCPGALYAGDTNCLAGDTQVPGTSVLMRGGSFGSYSAAGVFAVAGSWPPSVATDFIGFRAAR
jgi:hypothetical protein